MVNHGSKYNRLYPEQNVYGCKNFSPQSMMLKVLHNAPTLSFDYTSQNTSCHPIPGGISVGKFHPQKHCTGPNQV